MIKKVLFLPYKIVNGEILFFIGKRPKTGIYQAPTGHVEDIDKTLGDAVMRELNEELGIIHFRNFINLNESYNFSASKGEYEEHVFALEVGEQKIELQKEEFISYEFLPLEKAKQIVEHESHSKYMEIVEQTIKKGEYPKIFIFCGPGGGGKDSIIEYLLKDESLELDKLRTVTTRQRRDDKDDKEFVSVEKFDQMFEKKELLEKNFFKGNWYGAPRSPVEQSLRQGRNVIMEVDIHGAKSFKENYSNVIVFFVSVDIDVLRARLIKRGVDSLEEVEKRMEITKTELLDKDIADYVIENIEGELDQTVAKIDKIMKGDL